MSKFRPPSRPVRTAGVSTGSARLPISELKSDCGLKPVRTMVMVPSRLLRASVPVRFRLAIGYRADALGIADSHLAGIGVHAENQLIAVVAREAGEFDFAASGFAGEALDRGARAIVEVAVKHEHSAGVRNPVGHALDIEAGLLKLQASVDLRRVERSAHRGIHGERAVGSEVAIEIVHQAEIDAPGGVQIERVFLIERNFAGDGNVGSLAGETRAFHGNDAGGHAGDDRPGVVHHQLAHGQAARRRGAEFEARNAQFRFEGLAVEQRPIDVQLAFRRTGERAGLARRRRLEPGAQLTRSSWEKVRTAAPG